MPQPSKLVILEGPSGAGKSSLAVAMQEALLPEIWLSFSMDTLIYTLPPTVLHRCNTADDWAGVDGRAIGAAALRCLRALVECGNRVVFDLCLPNQTLADTLLHDLADLSPVSIGVRCEWAEVEIRTRQRGDRSLAEAERSFRQTFALPRYDLTLDTTVVSLDFCVKECLFILRSHQS